MLLWIRLICRYVCLNVTYFCVVETYLCIDELPISAMLLWMRLLSPNVIVDEACFCVDELPISVMLLWMRLLSPNVIVDENCFCVDELPISVMLLWIRSYRLTLLWMRPVFVWMSCNCGDDIAEPSPFLINKACK